MNWLSDKVYVACWAGPEVNIRKFITLLPFGSVELGASLKGINGYTGRGSIAFSMRRSGKRRLGVALKGIAGQQAELYADGKFAAAIALRDGAAESRLDSRRGDNVPVLDEGARIEIRQNGDAILEGALIRA